MRKFNHASKPVPRTSPVANSRKVVTAAHGNAAPGHNLHSGRRGRRSLAIGPDRPAPGASGPALASGIGPGGALGMD
jgi:hypothetical protein